MSVIVIFGLPGSGKTTCIQELLKDQDSLPVELLSRPDFESWSRNQSKTQKLFLYFRSAPTYFSILKPYLKIAIHNFSSGIEFWKRILLSPIYFIYMRYFMKSHNQIYLSDHGSVQELWSILIRCKEISERFIENVIDKWKHQSSFKYIYFQNNPSIAAKRIVNRKSGNSLFDGKLFEQIEDDLIKAHVCYEHLANIIKNSGIDIYYVKNEGELSTAVSDFKKYFMAEV